MRTALTFCLLGLAACSWLPAHIKSGDVSVSAPRDNGSPAVLDKGETKTAIAIPAGTKVVTTRTESTQTSPAQTVTQYDFSQPTKFEEVSNNLRASTGTIDTSVAEHKIDVASKTPLLYAAIASLVLAVAMVYLEHPSAAVLCGIAAGIFFLCWKLAELPQWVWACGATAIVGGLCLVFGHAKGVKNIIAANPTADLVKP